MLEHERKAHAHALKDLLESHAKINETAKQRHVQATERLKDKVCKRTLNP